MRKLKQKFNRNFVKTLKESSLKTGEETKFQNNWKNKGKHFGITE